ncbi:ABC transporter ATP-binding protein [Rhodococcus qingshengii]|uniref:ABC transporter ATP-binding protein n=1 Tax=Rhodococcus qingshengii TaxID=334542 RepID=UPI0010A61DE8|nr:ABC transporter ATP-binding protein [Rhodococcus qingshengii]THJ67603.1 ABC transporter ATP-binding protein [Rhodococcus qingshengii]
MSAPGLLLNDVDAGYGPLQVLREVSLEVSPGGITTLLGANGAGKSTLLRAISGLIPMRGEITLGGERLSGKSPESIVRCGVAQVPEGRGTFPNLTVEENLRVGAMSAPRSSSKSSMEKWLTVFPRLHERKSQRAGSLSGGEQQMLAIARAMMSQPTLLLLDEPSMGLAPNITSMVFEQLAQINREEGVAILVVEQNANLALGIATNGYVMESGRIVAAGTSEELLANKAVESAYLQV